MVVPMCPPFVITPESLPGRANYVMVDLSSCEKKKGEVRKMFLEFDKDQIQKDLPVDIESGKIADQKFNPNEIVKVLFARENPRDKM